jgi:hypothetical protein
MPPGEAARQIGPDAQPGQAAVGGDGEGGEPAGVSPGEDERRAARGDGHAVGEGEPAGSLTGRAVRAGVGEDTGSELARREAGADVSDAGMTRPSITMPPRGWLDSTLRSA